MTLSTKHPTAATAEVLEARRLLSAVAGVMHSLRGHQPIVSNSGDVQGYTPSEIKTAYGFDQVHFSDGTVTPDGSGQTIAIVDAFADPNIAGDLAVFDRQFSLAAPPSLKVVSQSGGANLPAVDPGWANEISLDVEWAHAIAPGASILLVETNSDSTSDLMTGVNYARKAAGVSVVSMSWGGSEFVDLDFNESQIQKQLDVDFSTPAGHTPITFVAASGDAGPREAVLWPGSSPNVLSVGGTTLNFIDSNGDYGSESSWVYTSGGISNVETEPVYQEVGQTSGSRTSPDVSYDASPDTGFAIYDSLSDQGYVGWQVVGGTSAGSPQWAALVAIADQGRVSAGLSTLDGSHETLPALYSLYSPPNTSGYSNYSSAFNDVQSDSGPFHRATAGYDDITGLGSPNANYVVSDLVDATGTFAPSVFANSPITGQFLNAPPATVVGGAKGSLKLRLTNSGSVAFNGPLSVELDARPQNEADFVLQTLGVGKVKLAPHQTKIVTLNFVYSAALDGTLDVLRAQIQTTAIQTTPSVVDAIPAVAVEPPTVDLQAAYAASTGLIVNAGRPGTAAIRVMNLGNVVANGTIQLSLTAPDGSVVGTVAAKPIHIAAGKSAVLQVRFVDPAEDVGGTFNFTASISSSTSPADDDLANNIATIPTRATGSKRT